MRSRIIEMAVRGREPEGNCEDHVEVTGHFIGVFDGVTGRGRAVSEKLLIAGATPGRWAATTAGAALRTLPADAGPEEALERMRAALAEGMAAEGVDGERWDWPAATQAAVFSSARNEIWRMGDIHVAIDGKAVPARPTPLDAPAAAYRSALTWAHLAAGADPEVLRVEDPGRRGVADLLELQHHLRNHPDATNPFAHPLLDGRRMPGGAFEVIPADAGAEVVLATDGYLVPAATLRLAEEQLAHLVATDPLRIGVEPGLKAVPPGGDGYDDRAYLRFTA